MFIQQNVFENVAWTVTAILFRPQCVNLHMQSYVFRIYSMYIRNVVEHL